MRTLRWLLLGGWLPSLLSADLVFTLVRVFTGLTLALSHGWGKVSNPEGIIGMSATMDVPLPTVAGWLAALTEFVGGLLLAAGLLTRPAAFFICCNMLVAAIGWHIMHQNDSYGEMEPAFLFLALALPFVVIGSGRFGIDRFLRR